MKNPMTSNAASSDDFVFRTADRMRIDGCANAIAHEGLSLSLQCEHEALLDHYLSLLLKRLRQEAPEHSIEVYFPTNTESLLNRFNEVLAVQTLDQAARAPSSSSRAQIWIVHDAQSLPDTEIQLLARLIQNFPGANIRAILLMTGSGATSNSLAAFGRKILRWEIEAPSPEHAQAALETARHEGRMQPVQQLLNRINRQTWASNASPVAVDAASFAQGPDASPSSQSASPVKQQVQAFHHKGRQALNKSSQVLGHWRQKHSKLTLAVVAALALSTLTMLWLQPEAFGITSGRLTVKTNTTATPRAAAPNNLLNNDNNPAVVQTATDPSTGAATQAPSTETISVKTSTSNLSSAEASAPSLATGTTSDVEGIEAIRGARALILKMDPQSFLLQYGTADSFAKASEAQRRFSLLQTSTIVATLRPGEKLAQFVIVGGPYSQAKDAFAAARQPNIPNGSWVRSTSGLQNQLAGPSASQESMR